VEAETARETEKFGSETGQPNHRPAMEIAEEDAFRAQIYGLLSRVLVLPMSVETLAILCGLNDVEADTDLSKALKGLGELAMRTPQALAEDEYSALFYGMGSGGELHPYASYYLTGFVYEKPLADLRRDMTELGIEPSDLNDEPEDHIGFLMEVMHGLITGRFGDGADTERQRDFFMRHIAPWATLLFKDLEKAENAKIYMPVGTLGKLFMTLEEEAFEMIAA